MPIAAGSRLGPYEIHSLIGAGGMGEVYKARDTRLDRTVAIKVLRSELSADPDRRARFEREARTVAGLNHPHICTLYDIGDAPAASGQSGMYLVMEYVDGETLSARLQMGPLPLDQVLGLGAQMADALAAAHRVGVVHRDLKPGNVTLTKAGVKLLDFGLAKARAAASATAALAPSALTTLEPVTGQGIVFGTVPYMSPEQLQGKDVDPRSDLFSFGCVLYEMATGKRPFQGESSASLVASILMVDPPPISTIQPITPPALDRLVRKCLQKDPDARWQTATDVADELRWIATGSVAVSAVGGVTPASGETAPVRWWHAAALVLALAAGLAGGALLWRSLGPRPLSPTVEHLHLSLVGTGLPQAVAPAISPDGSKIAFRASEDGKAWRLYLWSLRDGELTRLDGTEETTIYSFSPDGSSLAYAAPWPAARIWRVGVTGGQPVPITPGLKWGLARGLRWEADGTILFVYDNAAGVWQVPGAGGTPTLIVPPDERDPNIRYQSPQLLPGGDRVLYTVLRTSRPRSPSVKTFSLRTHERATVLPEGRDARFLPKTGHLIYGTEEERTFAVRFNAGRSQVEGEAQALDQIPAPTGWQGAYDVAQNGTLVYVSRSERVLTWKRRDGTQTHLAVQLPGNVTNVELSPDGRRAVLNVQALGQPGTQLHVVSLDDPGAGLTRLTDGVRDSFGTFSCDGSRLLFTRVLEGGSGVANIFAWPLTRSGEAVAQTNGTTRKKVTSVGPACPSGDLFLYNEIGDDEWDVVQQRMDRPETAKVLVKGTPHAFDGAFSPDGRWLAYASNRTLGRDDIYVQAYPDGVPTRVSTAGGRIPVWNPRQPAGELFFQLGSSVFAVRIVNGRRAGEPERLFDRGDMGTTGSGKNWAVAPDGDRFLVAGYTGVPAHLNVVRNWFEELKTIGGVKRAPR